jgi:mono/diheme cytochrome c family protein
MTSSSLRPLLWCGILWAGLTGATSAAEFKPASFFASHCTECHGGDAKKGGLDLTALKPDFAARETFARWEKVFDRVARG